MVSIDINEDIFHIIDKIQILRLYCCDSGLPKSDFETVMSETCGIGIENRIYREQLKESLGMNFFSPFQP